MRKILIEPKMDKLDIIGDIHGSYDQLSELLSKLGYLIDEQENRIIDLPEGRRLVFLGDYVDRGPEPVKVLDLVMNAVEHGVAYALLGNHEDKLYRKLIGRNVEIKEPLRFTIEKLELAGSQYIEKVVSFIESLPYQAIFDNDNLFIAHGGMKEEIQGVDSKKAFAFAMYGDVHNEFDEEGYPIRKDWGQEYAGKRIVVYGHTPIEVPEWENNTINIDTGCFQSGILTALRWPESELVQTKIEY